MCVKSGGIHKEICKFVVLFKIFQVSIKKLKDSLDDNGCKQKTQVTENIRESLPFILSSSEESDENEENKQLLPNKVYQENFTKSTSVTTNDDDNSDQSNDDLSEIKRNKWRTVIINVGGVCYRSKISNFSKYPASRLGKIFRAKSTSEILEHCDGYKPGNPPVIFFDRNDQNFTAIIDSYRMGELHVCAQNCSLVTQVQSNTRMKLIKKLSNLNYFTGRFSILGY